MRIPGSCPYAFDILSRVYKNTSNASFNTLIMSFLTSFCLSLLHFLYQAVVILLTFIESQSYQAPPTNTKVPKHIAILLHSDDRTCGEEAEKIYLESIETILSFCYTKRIGKLTVFDPKGEKLLIAFETYSQYHRYSSILLGQD